LAGQKKKWIELEPREILQIDAAVIAGALVLLTIQSLSPSFGPYFTSYTIAILVGAIIIPFALSAVLTTIGSVNGKRLMVYGFLSLIGLAITVMAISAFFFVDRINQQGYIATNIENNVEVKVDCDAYPELCKIIANHTR